MMMDDDDFMILMMMMIDGAELRIDYDYDDDGMMSDGENKLWDRFSVAALALASKRRSTTKKKKNGWHFHRLSHNRRKVPMTVESS